MVTQYAVRATDAEAGTEDEFDFKLRVKSTRGSAVGSATGYRVYGSVDLTIDELPLGRRFNPIREQFRNLADWWHEATDQLSSPDQIGRHRAYRRIIDEMGEAALPYIFEDLKERGGFWYKALREITHASPVPANARGNVRLMKKAWLDWAKEHHYNVG